MAQLDNTIVNGILRAQTIATNILKDSTGSAGTAGQVMTVNSSGQAVWATGYAPATSGAFATYASSAGYAANSGQLGGQAGSYYRNASNLNNGTVPNAVLPARLQQYNTNAVALNTLTNGFYYVTTASYIANPFYYRHTSYADFQILSSGYDSSWGNQYARDFRSNSLAIRNSNSGTWTPWAEVWTTANIGLTYKGSMQMTTDNSVLVCRANTQNWTTNIVYSTRAWKSSVRIKWRAVDNTHYLMMGLDAAPTEIISSGWNALDHAFYLQANGKYDIRESGTTTTPSGNTYAANDEFAIEYSGEKIYYYKNGALIRTVARTIGNPLCAAGTFYNEGAIKDFEIHSISDLTMNPPHAGSAGYAASAGSTQYASSAGYAASAGSTPFASSATFASFASSCNYATTAQHAQYAMTAQYVVHGGGGSACANYASSAGYATVAGKVELNTTSSGTTYNLALVASATNAIIRHYQDFFAIRGDSAGKGTLVAPYFRSSLKNVIIGADVATTWVGSTTGSVVIGRGNTGSEDANLGDCCVIVGPYNDNTGGGSFNTMIGQGTWTVGGSSVAIGHNAGVITSGGVAIGENAYADGGIAIGSTSASQSMVAMSIGGSKCIYALRKTATAYKNSSLNVGITVPLHSTGLVTITAPEANNKSGTQRIFALTYGNGAYTAYATEITNGDGLIFNVDVDGYNHTLDLYCSSTEVTSYNTAMTVTYYQLSAV